MAFNIGELVLAFWKNSDAYFFATIVEQKDEQCYVVFADGDQGWVPTPKIKKLELKEGLKVMAKWSNGSFYPGTIAKMVSGAFYIHFDDGDKGWTSLAGIAIK
jgi:hypothetical protein